jgi:hypothetical protein
VTPYVVDMDENPGRIAEIIDKRLDGSYDLKSITRVAKVAMRCVQAEPSLRPSVTEVVRELKKAMKIEDKASFHFQRTLVSKVAICWSARSIYQWIRVDTQRNGVE